MPLHVSNPVWVRFLGVGTYFSFIRSCGLNADGIAHPTIRRELSYFAADCAAQLLLQLLESLLDAFFLSFERACS